MNDEDVDVNYIIPYVWNFSQEKVNLKNSVEVRCRVDQGRDTEGSESVESFLPSGQNDEALGQVATEGTERKKHESCKGRSKGQDGWCIEVTEERTPKWLRFRACNGRRTVQVGMEMGLSGEGMGFVGIGTCSVTDTVTLRGQQKEHQESFGKLGPHQNNQAEVLAQEVCIHCRKGRSWRKYRE